MKIKYKLWLGFGLILVLFSSLSIYLNIQLGKIGNETLQVLEHPLNAVNNSHAAWNTFRDSRDLVAIELAAIQFSDATTQAQLLAQQQVSFNQYLEHAEAAASILNSSTDFDKIKKLSQNWYRLNIQRIGGEPSTSLPVEHALTLLDHQLYESLHALIDDSVKAADIQKALTTEHIQLTQSISLIAMLLVLALGIVIAIFITLNLQKPLLRLMQAVKNLAHGEADLTKRLNLSSQDEIGELGKELDVFIERIHTLVKETHSAVKESCMTLVELSEITEHTSQGALQQKNSLADTIVTIEDISAAVYQVRDSSQQAKSQVQQINIDTQSSLLLVNNASTGINELANEVSNASDGMQLLVADSNSISELITIIDEIADQTNLLALNAAIEAARAGDAGRGFAVVADEVRTLAMKTRESTENIQKTVSGIKTQVNHARDVMENGRELALGCVEQSNSVTESLESVSNKVVNIEQMNFDIAHQTEQQSSSMERINEQMSDVNKVAEDTENRTQVLTTTRLKLAQALTKVENNMAQFKL